MNIASKMFYSLGRFFDRDLNQRPQTIVGTQGPVYVDTDKPGEVYYSVPQIRLVYDRFSGMCSNVDALLVTDDEKEEIVDDKKFYKFMKQPNFRQSRNAFFREGALQKIVYGNRFVYKNVVAPHINKYPVSMRNISALYLTPILTGKFLDQVDMNGVVKHYEYRDARGKFEILNTDDIMWDTTPGLDDPLVGVSQMKGYKLPISNIGCAYDYLNVISSRRGAVGMLSNESKDQAGSTPLKKNEKDRITKEHLTRYGISEDQLSIIITEASLKWTPFSYPTKDLVLLEQIDANTLTLIDSLNLNINIFANKNSTYENVRMGYIQSYEDAIQPFMDTEMDNLTKFLKIPEGFRIKASFKHLAIMKEYRLKGMQAVKQMIEVVDSLVLSKYITPQQAVNMLKAEFGLI